MYVYIYMCVHVYMGLYRGYIVGAEKIMEKTMAILGLRLRLWGLGLGVFQV